MVIVCASRGGLPHHFTFASKLGFAEDPIYRNLQPSLSHLLEFDRLSNYDIQLFPLEDRQIHLYHAINKKSTPATRDERFFSRAFILNPDHLPNDIKSDGSHAAANAADYASASAALGSENPPSDIASLRGKLSSQLDGLLSEIEKFLVESIRSLEIAVSTPKFRNAKNHHIFLR